MLNHRRRRVRPLVGPELQRKVRQRDAHLRQDDARARSERAQGGEERVAEREPVRGRELVQVVRDLRWGLGLVLRVVDWVEERRTLVRKVCAAKSFVSSGASGAKRINWAVDQASFCERRRERSESVV